MMKIVAICNKGLKEVLGKQGVEIPFANNQDNGNWAALNNMPKKLHFHIYGRAKNSVNQIFGQAIHAPDPHSTFYDNNEPLTDSDILQIKEYIDQNSTLISN